MVHDALPPRRPPRRASLRRPLLALVALAAGLALVWRAFGVEFAAGVREAGGFIAVLLVVIVAAALAATALRWLQRRR